MRSLVGALAALACLQSAAAADREGPSLSAGLAALDGAASRSLLQSIAYQCKTIQNLTSASLTGVYCSAGSCPDGCSGGSGKLVKCRYGGLICAVRD